MLRVSAWVKILGQKGLGQEEKIHHNLSSNLIYICENKHFFRNYRI